MQSLRKPGRSACLLVLLMLFLLFTPGQDGAAQDQEPVEKKAESQEDSRFISPIVGWKKTEESRLSYFIPLYYSQEDLKSESRWTLMFPLLSWVYEKPKESGARRHICNSIPLLAGMGSEDTDLYSAWGYASPYLALGNVDYTVGSLEAGTSGASLLPWFPLLDSTFRLSLYEKSMVSNPGNSFTGKQVLTLPGLDLGIYESRSAGIESDWSLANLWGISLYRSTWDLPHAGFRPWCREFHAFHIVNRPLDWELVKPSVRMDRICRLEQALADARSGLPIESTGILDPMITYSLQGESTHSFGIEPLFHYHMDEGLSLPLLLTTFSSEGLEFGHAARHLFPILHGNEEGTRWDFLLNYGTVYDYDDYSAVDLKFLFNYQQRDRMGTAWGFLPYPIGHHPGTRLNPGVRYVQLTNHALSYWNVEEDWGFQALDPFLLYYEEEGGEVPKAKLNMGPFGLLYKQNSESDHFENSSLWGLLHSYETGEDSSAMTLGPLGILFRSKKNVDDTAYRFFWIFGYKSTPLVEQVTFLWMNLYSNQRSTIYPGKIEAPHAE